MQKNIRFNESQLIYLVGKARRENTNAGFLYKKSSDTGKWQQRYFVLYQNMLFYFENENASRPLGVVLLEGSYCERVITPLKGKESEKQVSAWHALWLLYVLPVVKSKYLVPYNINVCGTFIKWREYNCFINSFILHS